MVSDDRTGARPVTDGPQWGVGAADVLQAVGLAAFAAGWGPFSPRWVLVATIVVPLIWIGLVWANAVRGNRRLGIATLVAFLVAFSVSNEIEFDGSPGRGLTARLVVAALAALLVFTPVTVAAIVTRRRR